MVAVVIAVDTVAVMWIPPMYLNLCTISIAVQDIEYAAKNIKYTYDSCCSDKSRERIINLG